MANLKGGVPENEGVKKLGEGWTGWDVIYWSPFSGGQHGSLQGRAWKAMIWGERKRKGGEKPLAENA